MLKEKRKALWLCAHQTFCSQTITCILWQLIFFTNEKATYSHINQQQTYSCTLGFTLVVARTEAARRTSRTEL